MTANPTARIEAESCDASDNWTRPSAAFLRPLILTLLADRTTPLEARNQCHVLMRAINANNLDEIIERAAHLRPFAEACGFHWP
jgi:hypothetical protein